MKKFFLNPWTVAVGAGLILLAVSYFVGVGKGVPGSKLEENYAPQQMNGSPDGVQVQGNGNIVNKYPPAKLSYDILSSSQKQSDGLYHTTFGIYVYYAQGMDAPNITISKVLNCPAIDETNTSVSLVPNGERIGLSCTSKDSILNKTELFSI
jgi:hypothetical protein